MNKNILQYINTVEGWKTAIKSLHWSASSYSQHELCDRIADDISGLQDKVSEIAQGIHGTMKNNQLKPKAYSIKSLKKFVEDVINQTMSFHKSLTDNKYIGIKSEVESFIGKMQQNLYLINFTIKEDKKQRLAAINESKRYVIIEGANGNRVKLTESDFKSLLSDSVKKALFK